ncbi:MAG: hypothetical protein HY075_14000 [Deltaproteobacteria bacterium]|nr:hypothetical protein [Deltaproteobacteria bacterium]
MIDRGYPNVAGFIKEYAEQCKAAKDHSPASGGKGDYCTVSPATTPGGRDSTRALPAAYEHELAKKVIGTVDDRLGECAAVLARFWASAYEAAGRPELSGCGDVKFDQGYAIQNYPRANDAKAYGYLPAGYTPGHR